MRELIPLFTLYAQVVQYTHTSLSSPRIYATPPQGGRMCLYFPFPLNTHPDYREQFIGQLRNALQDPQGQFFVFSSYSTRDFAVGNTAQFRPLEEVMYAELAKAIANPSLGENWVLDALKSQQIANILNIQDRYGATVLSICMQTIAQTYLDSRVAGDKFALYVQWARQMLISGAEWKPSQRGLTPLAAMIMRHPVTDNRTGIQLGADGEIKTNILATFLAEVIPQQAERDKVLRKLCQQVDQMESQDFYSPFDNYTKLTSLYSSLVTKLFGANTRSPLPDAAQLNSQLLAQALPGFSPRSSSSNVAMPIASYPAL